MADAVIVATARSPIGRAFKGSLKDLRSDNLTATIVRAALDAAAPDVVEASSPWGSASLAAAWPGRARRA